MGEDAKDELSRIIAKAVACAYLAYPGSEAIAIPSTYSYNWAGAKDSGAAEYGRMPLYKPCVGRLMYPEQSFGQWVG